MNFISKVGLIVLVLLLVLIYGCTTIQVQPKPLEPEPTPAQFAEWTLTKNRFNAWECTTLPNVSNTIIAAGFKSEKECVDSCLNVPTPQMEGNDCEIRQRKIECLADQTKFWLSHQDSVLSTCIDKNTQDACTSSGGLGIKMFSDGCGDSCGEKPRICTLAFKSACDCGVSKCWNGTSCVNDVYEPYESPEEACKATGGNWTFHGGGCRAVSTGVKCGGIEGVICQGKFSNPEVGCRFRDNNKTLLLPSSPAPYPDAMGECYAIACFSRGVKCVCPPPLTFGLQGCTDNSNNFLEPKQLMSIAGEWN